MAPAFSHGPAAGSDHEASVATLAAADAGAGDEEARVADAF